MVRPVNYNCPGQLVIAGEKAALAEAIENCKAAGARRALPLAVSGAFHTPLMAKAAAELRAYVADFTFSAPKMDIYSNLDGKVYDCSDLPAHLEQHMVSPVRWTQLLECLHRFGCKPEDAVYIGDSEYDMQCAKSAGVKSVLALWGCVEAEKLTSDLRFEHPAEILTLR